MEVHTSRLQWWMIASLGLFVLGCADESRPNPSFAVSDSAGVQVVVTDVPIWNSGRPWTLGTAPDLRVGLADGDAPYLFEDVRSVVLLDDGRVVVADGLSREIRFFDGSGAHVHTAGGAGEGPREFGDLAWVERCGEGLYALDRQRNRVSIWSLDGEFLEAFALLEPDAERVPYRSRCGPSGNFVVAGWGERPPPEPGTTFDFFAQAAPVWVMDPSSGTAVELGEYVSSERVLIMNPATGGGSSFPHPFGRTVVFALSDELVYVGGSERLQVDVRDYDGELLRILRGPDEDLLIGPDFISTYRSRSLTGRDSTLRASLEQGDMPMPQRMPAYTDFMLDSDGNLWVERFPLPWERRSRWGVFADAGEFYGHVEMPDGFDAMDVANGYVAGISEDEFEVERVEVYRLERN